MTAILEKILNHCNSSTNCITIGIDGPTASGKTTLADKLALELTKKGKKVWVYRVDWALENRDTRILDLHHLRKFDAPFCYEAQLHMRMNIVEDFLKKSVHSTNLIKKNQPSS